MTAAQVRSSAASCRMLLPCRLIRSPAPGSTATTIERCRAGDAGHQHAADLRAALAGRLAPDGRAGAVHAGAGAGALGQAHCTQPRGAARGQAAASCHGGGDSLGSPRRWRRRTEVRERVGGAAMLRLCLEGVWWREPGCCQPAWCSRSHSSAAAAWRRQGAGRAQAALLHAARLLHSIARR